MTAERKGLEQRVVWPTLAEFRCPPCSVERHWNHRADDGGCRSIDRVHDEECKCSWRPS